MLNSNQQRAAGLQHTAPRRFTGGSASLGSENASPNNPKCGTSPLGHTATSTSCQPNSLSRVYAHLKPAEDCWSTFPPPVPAAIRNHCADSMLTSNQHRAAGLQHTAPRRFTGGIASLGSENASPNNPKCGTSPLGHTATSTCCQPNSLSRVYAQLKPAEGCWSTFPPPLGLVPAGR
jgi:adenine-specific DNA glycosylase